MTTSSLRALPGGAATVAGHTLAIERSLARFPMPYRPRVVALASRHPRLAELARIFPGLLFGLAMPRQNPKAAIDLAIFGAPLKMVAAAADVPLWLRPLPPETFTAPLPALPDNADLRCRLANHLPRDRKLAPIWLHSIADAADLCDLDFAVWIARELVAPAPARKWTCRLRLLALYAWYSRSAGTTAGRLIRRPWTSQMSLAAATGEARAWSGLFDLLITVGGRHFDPWLRPGVVNGYSFVPLCTCEDIAEEAQAMKNCLVNYGTDIAEDQQRFWSIRRNGERVATLSVYVRPDGQILEIWELRAPGNKIAPREIWSAARCWLDQSDGTVVAPRERGSSPLDRQVWTALWRPYWLAKRRFPDWLPLAPTHQALNALW